MNYTRTELTRNEDTENILRKMSCAPEQSGGTSVPCTIVAVTVALCPTTKCTSAC